MDFNIIALRFCDFAVKNVGIQKMVLKSERYFYIHSFYFSSIHVMTSKINELNAVNL
jgi:hypothetical protein